VIPDIGVTETADHRGYLSVRDAEILDALVRRVDHQKEGTAASIAILEGDRMTVLAHGKPTVQADERRLAETIFQIASLTKIFTALLFADAAKRGEVGLHDRLEQYLRAPTATFEGRPITLLDLATHTSGLPLRPHSRIDRSQDNPYAGYTEADLYADLGAVRLSRPPGSMFDYSNFGYGLLGEALCRRTGQSFRELLSLRILDPLRMTDTALDLSRSMRSRLVQGYDIDFKPARPWTFGVLAPAGALFSSLTDLGKFLRLFLGSSQVLAASARSMLDTDRIGDDADTRMAIGWRKVTATRTPTFWSSGNAGGVRSFMGCCPDRGLGAIAYINKTSEIGIDDIGLKILRSWQ
jgi:serine-type D-Ala-D-Ala carboxypeptidase/endopeptidase